MKLKERSQEARQAYFDGYRAGIEAAAKYVEDKWWAHLPSGEDEDARMVAGIRALTAPAAPKEE